MVLDTGAVTRGSGSKNEDRERNIRKWFVERDLIDGVILLPDNLFYNTSAAGIIVVLSKRKAHSRKGKIVLVNASKRVAKGRPKNYIPGEDIRPIATAFLRGDPVEGEVAVITREQGAEADYNLSPSRWVGQFQSEETQSIPELLEALRKLFKRHSGVRRADICHVQQGIGMKFWRESQIGDEIELAYGKSLPANAREVGAVEVFGSNGCVGSHSTALIPGPGIVIGRKGSVGAKLPILTRTSGRLTPPTTL